MTVDQPARTALIAELMAGEDPDAPEYSDAAARIAGLLDAHATEAAQTTQLTDEHLAELTPLATVIRNTLHRTPVTIGRDAADLVAALTLAVAAYMGREVVPTVPTEPTEHDELWRHLDWSFWGTGMADVFREPLADTMIAAITPEQRAQANELITRWRDHREFVGRDKYEEQKAELDRLRAELATAKAAGYRQAADNAAEQIQLHGTDADAEMLLVFLKRGAELREQFAARQAADPTR